jgi:phosphoserine phosphatase RsbU/P
LPIGMFSTGQFSSRTVRVARGEMLLLYTDGLLETENAAGREYGIERLSALAASAQWQPKTFIDACLRDLAAFRATRKLTDDLTILAVSRS